MAKRRPSGDGMVRKRDDGRWEGRIVVGHKEDGSPIFHYVLAATQKELLDKLHHRIEVYSLLPLSNVVHKKYIPVSLWIGFTSAVNQDDIRRKNCAA